VIDRATFLALGAMALATPARAQTDDESDPATSARSPELRVLLGMGDAAPGTADGFTFEGRPYRGRFERIESGEVVSTVGLEEYLYSVVPHEMSPSWPAAALQAQAVCARTYVLARSNPRRPYDVVPSELDQVYAGMAAESPSGRAAVDASAGSVLRYGAAFAQMMYSSCCGGHTEASSDAWGGAPFPYLASVPCTTCTPSPYYRWSRELDLGAVAAAFAQELAPYGALRALQLGPRDPSGRSRSLELVAERGSTFVKGSTFRLRVGSRVLPSLLIAKMQASTEAPERIAIEGGGLGHGVGLCQWGARGMALQGASVPEILNFYFPGTEIEHD
jgi:stage II sporulation protein D